MANLAIQNNNPGNLKDTKTGSFRKFSTPDEGYSALEDDLNYKMSGKGKRIGPQSTLLDFANMYAPASDNNNPTQYAQNLAKQLGVKPETPIGNLQNRLHDFAHAVATNEGSNTAHVAASETNAQPQQTMSDNTQIEKPILTHSQLIENINAMEQQGAQPDEVQNYLDSLKSSQQDSSNTPARKTFAEEIGNLPAQQQTATSNNDMTAPGNFLSDLGQGKIGAAAQSGIRDIGNAITLGGSEQLGDQTGAAIAGLVEKAKGLVGGQDNSQYINQPSFGKTVGGGAKVGGALLATGGGGLLGELLGESLLTPELDAALKEVPDGIKNSVEFLKATPAGKYRILEEAAVKTNDTLTKGLFKQAMEKLAPFAQKEVGQDVEFSRLHPNLSKVGGLIGNLLKKGVGAATTIGLGAEGINLYNKYIK